LRRFGFGQRAELRGTEDADLQRDDRMPQL